MHSEAPKIYVEEVLRSEPIKAGSLITKVFSVFLLIGLTVFTVAMFVDQKHLWGVYYSNLLFWMGLAFGGSMIAVIVQIVRGVWSAPVRRLAEAHSSFLPYAYLLFLLSYLGRAYLFPWATSPMPGRETYMQADFVYIRFALFFGILIYMINRFVGLSLRSDIGAAKELTPNDPKWYEWTYARFIKNWRGTEVETIALQRQMSWNGPVIVLLYAVIYSLFSFEMIMGMNTVWYSNMYGGFSFVGNVYMGWAATAILLIYFCKISPAFNKNVSTNQLWDLGKLNFGFCMVWGYTFFAQFLPQWYGNMPEETAWMIVRTREFPWKPLAFATFGMCFVIPFIMLVSEDLKKTPKAYGLVACVVLLGLWFEKYMVVMPELYPTVIPFNIIEIGITLGFLGGYGLCVLGFMSKYPYIAASHPQAKGSIRW